MDTNNISKQKITEKVALLFESYGGLLYEAAMGYKTVIITFIKEAETEELQTIWSHLDRAGTHLVRAYKAAMQAWEPAQDIFDRTDTRIHESGEIDRIEKKMESLAEQLLEDGEELLDAATVLAGESEALQELRTNGQATADEMEVIAFLQDVAEDHNLETEAMATYTKRRADGYSPADAQQVAISEWDL